MNPMMMMLMHLLAPMLAQQMGGGQNPAQGPLSSSSPGAMINPTQQQMSGMEQMPQVTNPNIATAQDMYHMPPGWGQQPGQPLPPGMLMIDPTGNIGQQQPQGQVQDLRSMQDFWKPQATAGQFQNLQGRPGSVVDYARGMLGGVGGGMAGPWSWLSGMLPQPQSP